MKNYYLLLMAVALSVFACQKPSNQPGKPIPNDQQKFAVNLKIPEFTQRLEEQNAKVDTNLRKNVSMLIYTAMDLNTKAIVHQITKYISDSSFGEFRDSLPAGRYIVAVAGVNDTAYARLTDEKDGLYLLAPGTDAFYANATLKVDNEVSEYITIHREVAKVIYELNGRVPLRAKKITVSPMVENQYALIETVLDFYSGATIANPAYNKTMYTYIIPDSLIAGSFLTFSQYLLTEKPRIRDFYFRATDSTNHYLAGKNIYDVTTRSAYMTVLSGNFFGSIPSSGGVQVKLRTTWQEDTLRAEF